MAEEVLLTSPSFRKGNLSFFRSRGLGLINALAATKVQVIGSLWLPGLHIYTAEKAQRLPQCAEINPKGLLMVCTENPVEANDWFSFKADPLMVVENKWSSVEDYVASFKKKYRTRYRKILQQCGALIFKEISLEEDFDTCQKLYANTLAPKVAALPEDLGSLLLGYRNWFGDQYKIVAAYGNDELVAFIGYMEDGNVLRAMHFGASEGAPKEVYSGLMYEVIRRGIDQNCKEINLGRTATEIKSTYGAVARENYFSFHTKKRSLQVALRLAGRFYSPKSYTMRAPFKEMA